MDKIRRHGKARSKLRKDVLLELQTLLDRPFSRQPACALLKERECDYCWNHPDHHSNHLSSHLKWTCLNCRRIPNAPDLCHKKLDQIYNFFSDIFNKLTCVHLWLFCAGTLVWGWIFPDVSLRKLHIGNRKKLSAIFGAVDFGIFLWNLEKYF